MHNFIPALALLLAPRLILNASISAQAIYPGTEGFTDQQRALLTDARADITADRWDLALAKLQTLHAAVPDNMVVTKFEAEAEINTAKTADALALLRPLLATNPDDIQALAIAAHAYAQQRQSPQRDATLAHLQKLHDDGATKLPQLIVETDPLPNGGSVRIFYFLQPFSQYHISLMARVYDSAGKQLRRITLETGDFDQPGFAKEHPDLAAKGERRYSIDSYVNTSPTTQTQALHGFFDGRPTYDTFRDRALTIAQQPQPSAAPALPAPTPKQ